MSKARIESTDDGAVAVHLPTTAGAGFSANFTPDQAERMAHAMLIAAYRARGNTPSDRIFHKVRQWVLR